jgi:hypothetical protein
LNAVTTVLDYGWASWSKLRTWGMRNSLLNPKEDSLLAVASNPNKVPSDKQSAEVLKIRQRPEEEGYVEATAQSAG